MYRPQHFALDDLGAQQDLIDAQPFAAWVRVGPDGQLRADHLPLLLDRSRGPFGTLVGHVARANGIWQEGAGDAPALLLFQGAQGYVSPSWYPSKAEAGKAVPTWNYAVVHAQGRPTFFDEPLWLRSVVDALTARFEPAVSPWTLADAPPDFADALLRAIVGVEIPIDRLEGKLKMGQHRPQDAAGAVAGLRTQAGRETGGSEALARAMEAALAGRRAG